MNRKTNHKIIVLMGILLLFVALVLTIVATRIESAYYEDFCHGRLEKYYFVGGILSGILAIGAFIGVVLTLALQRNESRNAKKTNSLQRFENTFFNMMNMHLEIVNNLRFSYSKNPTSPYRSIFTKKQTTEHFTAVGREVFEHLYTLLLKDIIERQGISRYLSTPQTYVFDHYFRYLYRILKFVDQSKLTDGEKYSYVSMLRATLSSWELCWIYYNGLSYPKLKAYIEYYSLLKNINVDQLFCSKEFREDKNKTKNDQKCRKNNFPRNDYNFFITYSKDDKNDKRYYVQAFYKEDELSDAIAELHKREYR